MADRGIPYFTQLRLPDHRAGDAARGLGHHFGGAIELLGLGVPAPAPEWGSMLSAGRAYIRDYSYMTLYPGIAIMVTVLSLNLIGDGLRDALDQAEAINERLRSKR